MMSEKPLFKIEAEELSLRANAVRPLPLLLIGGGIALLALELLHISLLSLLWPLFVIGPGLLLLVPARELRSGVRGLATFLAVPGALLLTVGVLLGVMNVTGHFEAWAYSWVLLPAAVAAGLAYALRHQPEHAIHRSAPRLINLAGKLFIGLGLVFELFVFETLGAWWPVALIGLGAYILIQNRQDGTVKAA